MHILDAVIIVGFIIGIIGGMKRGLIKSSILLVGIILGLILSFYLKNPVSAFFYKNLPFISFKGTAPIFNIILYEFIAFLLIFSVYYLILRILLKITGLIEKILKATVILGFFSSLGGIIVGFIEALIVIYIFLFLFNQPFINITGLKESKFANTILEKTPIMANATEEIRDIVIEIDALREEYGFNSDTYNKKLIDLFIEKEIVSKENIDILIEKGKIKY